jgi:hypothetical protein
VAGLVLSSSGDHGGSPVTSPTSATPTALPNTGPFTGTFTADMSPRILANGTPSTGSDVAGFSETWRLRSACTSHGCVATASSGGRYPAKDLVFDNVDGQWFAVTTTRRNCLSRGDDEAWDVISLQPQPNGTMTGESFEWTTNACFNKRTVVFTRTGDTDLSLLPDPATLAARVVSPAQALHGSYDAKMAYSSGSTVADHFGVRTDCLRTGDRCISPFYDLKTNTNEVFVFGNGAWTRNEEFDGACPTGGTIHIKHVATLPLPQPPQDPITLLAGHGYVDVTTPGSKCQSQSYDEKFTRTGD